MITLSQAIKLTEDALNYGVYLRRAGDRWTRSEWFLLKTIREQADMKRIKVHKIGFHPVFSEYSGTDLEFEVSGEGVEELFKRRWRT